MTHRLWSPYEDRIVLDNWERLSPDEICELLNELPENAGHPRKLSGLDSRMRRIGKIKRSSKVKGSIPSDSERTLYGYRRLVAMDAKFKRAMIAAGYNILWSDINETSMTRRPWSAIEDKIVLDNLARDADEICELLNALPEAADHLRSRSELSNRMRELAKHLGKPVRLEITEAADKSNEVSFVAMDNRFQRAMMAAGYKRTAEGENNNG